MPRPIKHVGLYSRTGYFVDGLLAQTGLTPTQLEQRIRQKQFAVHGLQSPSAETVRDYFRLRASPAIDPQDGKTPPWLLACELEFEGSAYRFFHPIFDLLLGQIESSTKWIARLQRIPQQWIDKEEGRGNHLEAKEWRDFNQALKPQRGRPAARQEMDTLSFIHLTLMRLPEHIFAILFDRKGVASTYARSYRSIDTELSDLVGFGSMDSLAALVGLTLEAAEIGHMDRLHKTRQAVRESLQFITGDPSCRRIGRRLISLIDSEFCLKKMSRRYAATLQHGFGLPATWRTQIVPPCIALGESRFNWKKSKGKP